MVPRSAEDDSGTTVGLETRVQNLPHCHPEQIRSRVCNNNRSNEARLAGITNAVRFAVFEIDERFRLGYGAGSGA